MSTPPHILARGPFALDQLLITWNPEPRDIPTAAIDFIDERWDSYRNEARRTSRMLYNGLVAELRSAAVNDNRLEISLSPTDYKTFLISTIRDRDWFLSNAPNSISPALGNSILLTSGDKAVLGVRSKAVAAYPGWAHLFGGVLNAPDITGAILDTSFVLAHLYQELQEEINLSPDLLTAPPRMLALLRDDFLNQPELTWHAPLKCPIAHLIKSLNIEEHDQFVVMDMAKPAESSGFELTPIARMALDIYRSLGTQGTV